MTPAANPKYIVLAVVEEGGYGAETAAPIVRRIMQGLNNLPAHRRRDAPAGGGQLVAAVLTDRRARLQTSPLRHLDLALVIAPILISGLGLLMIYSATHTKLEQAGDDPLSFVKRQAIAIVLGIIGMAIMTVIDYRRLRELALFGYAATVFLLVVVLGIGVQVKGAQARFDVGPFQLQPGELAKLFVILVLAGYCAMHRGELDVRHLAVALLIAGVPMGLIMLQPDLGTDLVLMFIVLTMLTVAGARGRHLVILLLLAATVAIARREPRRAEGLPDRATDLVRQRGQGRRALRLQPGAVEDRGRERRPHRRRACSRAPRPTAPTSRSSTPTSSSPWSARSSASSVAPRCSPSSR